MLREYIKNKYGFTDLDDFDRFYETVVRELGFEEVHRILTAAVASDEELTAKFAEDEHFNNIPLSRWDHTAGFVVWENKRLVTQEVSSFDCSLKSLLRNKCGVTSIAASEGVCILKTCARMVAKEVR